MEDALGVDYESREPYLTEILLFDRPSGALAGFAASAVAILAALTIWTFMIIAYLIAIQILDIIFKNIIKSVDQIIYDLSEIIRPFR